MEKRAKSLQLKARTPTPPTSTGCAMVDTDFDWLSERHFLAGGAEGRVFGPLSTEDFPDDFPVHILNPKKRYIVKKFHKKKTISELGSLNDKYKIINQFVRQSDRHFFILPVAVGISRNKRFITGEVQEYGGIELFDWINDQTKKDIPFHLFPTLKKICKTCIEILNKHNILITDIKPENMVMQDDGNVSLIDFDFLIIGSDEPKGFMTTFSPLITPAQFMDIMSKYHTNARYIKHDMLRRYRGEQMTSKVFFEPPKTAKPPKTVKQSKTATHTIPSDIEIALFSLLWVFINTIQIILRFKGNKKSLERFYHTFNAPMFEHRTRSINHLVSSLFDKPPT